MLKVQPTLTVPQALKIIRLETNALIELEKGLGVKTLEKEAAVAVEQGRETFYEALQAIKHKLQVLRGQVELLDEARLKQLIRDGLVPGDIEVPEIDLSAGAFTHRVTIGIPNEHKFNQGMQIIAREHDIPQQYWEIQKRNLPLFNKLTDPKLTQGELNEAFIKHTMEEFERSGPKR